MVLQKEHNKLRFFGMVLAFILMVLLMANKVMAEEGSGTQQIHHVTFENEKPETTALFISKEVQSENEAYAAPQEESFTFTLKLNGDAAKNREYYLLNKLGERVYVYTDNQTGEVTYTTTKNESKIESALKTDRSGTFQLKGGWTAVFDGLEAGDTYEISEEEQEGYVQTQPVEGTNILGTMVKEGNHETFVNTYLVHVTPPPTDDEEEEEPTTSMKIIKQISYPAGYELPETPNFTFSLTVRNSYLQNWDYEVYNEKGEKTAVRKTNESGECYLKGGEYIILNDLPLQADYKVEEKTTDGWRVLGAETMKGAMAYPETVLRFSNASASFGVSKKMGDSSTPDYDFSFVLADENGNPMSNITYYLYNKQKQLIEKEALHQTDTAGKFTLRYDQTAIFAGLAPGTKYQVTEEEADGYVQTLPADNAGYSRTVSDSLEILPFVNEEDGSQISVTKKVINISGEDTVPNETFTFVLSKVDDEGNEEPAANKTYTVGSQEFKTGEDGTFTLKQDETALFLRLKKGNYKVEEVNIPDKFFCNTTNPMTFDTSTAPKVTFINGYGEMTYTTFSGEKKWLEGEQAAGGGTATPTPDPAAMATPTPDPGVDATPTPAAGAGESTADSMRPRSILVHLYQNNVLYDTKEVEPDENGDWKYEWTDLPEKCGRTLKDAEYSVREEPIEGYRDLYAGKDIYNVKTEPIYGEKTWLVADTSKITDSITVNLLQNGTVIDTRTVTAAEGWQYDFGEQMVCDLEGNPYIYTVEEASVPSGLMAEYDGYDIYNIELTEIEGKKTWDDGDAPDRPTSVTVHLVKDGEEIDTQTVDDSSGWKYSFTDLPMYHTDGTLCQYAVKEDVPAGYKATYNEQGGSVPAGLRITFSSDSKTEGSYDYVVIYYKDENGTWNMAKNSNYVTSASYCYYSTKLANAVVEVPTTDFYLFFRSDSSVSYSSYMGFKVVSVEPIDALSGNTTGVTSSNFSSSNPETVMAGTTSSIYTSATTATVKNKLETSDANDLHVYQSEYTNNMGSMFHYVGQFETGTPRGILNHKPTATETNTISIQKLDDNGDAVVGAKLELYTAADTEKPVHTWVSAETPEVLPYMEAGDYVVHEVEAPSGYKLAADITITVTDSPDVQEFTMIDPKVQTHASIQKVDVNGNPVSGADMQLLDAGKANVVHEWTTSDTPEEINGLEAGIYYIHEKKAPAGYYVGKDIKIKIEVTEDPQSFTFTDEFSKGGIRITKVDESGRPLDGAKFQIYADEALTRPVTAKSSNERGVLSFEDMEPGTYYLKELKSGAGTSLLLNPIKVVLTQTANGITYKVNDTDVTTTDTSQVAYLNTEKNGDIIINIKVTDASTFTLPSTGGNGIIRFVFLLVLAGLMIYLVYFAKRTREVLKTKK